MIEKWIWLDILLRGQNWKFLVVFESMKKKKIVHPKPIFENKQFYFFGWINSVTIITLYTWHIFSKFYVSRYFSYMVISLNILNLINLLISLEDFSNFVTYFSVRNSSKYFFSYLTIKILTLYNYDYLQLHYNWNTMLMYF